MTININGNMFEKALIRYCKSIEVKEPINYKSKLDQMAEALNKIMLRNPSTKLTTSTTVAEMYESCKRSKLKGETNNE